MIGKIRKLIKKIKSNNFWGILFKNSFFAILGEGSASVINLLVVILLIRLIGSAGYGLLTLAQSYMLIMDSIINMQCWKSVIKFGEQSLVNKDIDSYVGYVKLGTVLDVSTAILGCIISFFLSSFIGNIFNWDPTLITCAQIFSIVILFHFSGTPTAVLRMENKFNLVAIQKIVSSLIKIITIILLLVKWKSISVITGVIIYAITDIVGHLLLVVMSLCIIHKKCGIKKIYKSKWPKNWKEFTKFTVWTTLSDTVDIPVQQFDVFIVSKLGLEMVSVYKFFKQIIAIISKLTTPIYQAIFPQFSRLAAEKKEREGYNVVLKIRNTIIKYFLPLSIIFGITSYWWLGLLFNDLYSSNWYVLTIYLITHTIALSYTTIHPYFVSLGQVFNSFLYVLISNIVYVICAYLLINNLGIMGLIISYTIQYFIVIFLKNLRIKKLLGEHDEAIN